MRSPHIHYERLEMAGAGTIRLLKMLGFFARSSCKEKLLLRDIRRAYVAVDLAVEAMELVDSGGITVEEARELLDLHGSEGAEEK